MSNSSIKVDNNNNNTDNTNDTVNDDAASSAAPAAASAAAPQQPMATRESQEAMLHRLGLDVRTIVGVAALYAGTFAAFCYYIASSLYLVLCMYAGSSFAPVDPRRKEAATRDSGYSDEFCAIKPSSSSSSSSTANNNSNSSGGIDAASDPETLAARVFAECNDARKVCIIHGPPGSGKSTLLRRVAATVPGSVIFAKVTPRIATSDPIAIVGEHCDEAHPAFVLRLLRRLPAVGDGRRAHRPTLVFDIETPGGAVSSGGSFGDAHARAASSSPGDFNFLKFMEHCKSLACDAGEFNIIVAVDSSVLYSAAPQFARHECFDLARVGELTSEQASRMVAESTDVYTQSLVRESKRTLRFVKDRLAAEMRKAAATDGNGDGDVMAHGRRIVRAERDEMAQAAWSAFARCRDEPAMRLAAAGGRAAVADAAAPVVPLTWAMVEQHCGNRYTSNAQFRDVAEVRESVVTSIGPSAYVPRCDAMRGLIANADADGKKK